MELVVRPAASDSAAQIRSGTVQQRPAAGSQDGTG
jgi:hypothetical protein